MNKEIKLRINDLMVKAKKTEFKYNTLLSSLNASKVVAIRGQD